MINISSIEELNSWNGTTNAILTNNIIISSGTWPKTLGNTTFDGDGYTLTIPSGFTSTLFSPTSSVSCTVKDLEVTISDGLTMSSGVLFGSITVSYANITVQDCAINGSFTLGPKYGGIIGKIYSVQNTIITITGCYCTGIISSFGGGIIGETNIDLSGDNTISILNCYSTGSNNGLGSGGIVGGSFAEIDSGSQTITNCYSTGNMTQSDSYGGGIVGTSSHYATITNCYSTGTRVDNTIGFIIGWISNSNSASIINCYALNATTPTQLHSVGAIGGVPTITNCQVAITAGTWNADLGTSSSDTGLYNTGSVPWINTSPFSSSTPFGLTRFRTSPWNTYYDSFQDSAQFLSSGSSGDPHINTLDGKRYDLLSKGVFNLFDNNISDARLVINADTIYQDHPIWNDKEYINNLFIHYKGKGITIKPGFRGRNAEILDIDEDFESDPQITINKSEDKLSQDHKMFCSQCKYRTRDHKLMHRHRRNNNHSVLSCVRNSINITINDEYNQYNINISNVNKDNFHPASVTLKLVDKTHYDTYSGAIIKEHPDYGCDIEHLHYIQDT